MEIIKRATITVVMILGHNTMFNIDIDRKVTVTYRCIDKSGSNFMMERLGKLDSCTQYVLQNVWQDDND